MPRYSITDSSTGRTMVVEGDSPPTEQEAEQLFASQGQPKQAFAATPYGVGGGVSTSADVVNKMGPNIARYGLPVAAGAATGGLGLMAQAGAQAVAGGAGELAAQAMEGRDVTAPENRGDLARTVAANMVPIPAGARAAGGILSSSMKAAGKTGGALMAGQVAGEVASQVAETGEFSNYNRLAESLPVVVLASTVGGSLSGLSNLAGKTKGIAERNAETREFLSEVGIDKPALVHVLPEYADLVKRRAATDQELQKQISATPSKVMDEWMKRAGEIPTNEMIAKELGGNAGVVDGLAKQLSAAEAAAKATQDSYGKALQAAVAKIPGAEQAAAQAAIDQLSAVRQKAAAAFAAQHGLGKAASITAVADDMTRSLDELKGAAKSVSDRLYAATGIDPSVPVVSRDLIKREVVKALGNEAKSMAGKSIIKAVDSVGDALEDAAGKQAPASALSWDGFRELRNRMSEQFVGNDNYLNRAEALASKAYEKAGEAFRTSIAANVSEEAAKSYDVAQGFWRDWAQIRDSNLGRSLFQVPRRNVEAGVASGVLASTMEDVASKMLKGDVQAIRSVKQAVDTIGKHSPEHAAQVMGGVSHAIKGAIVHANRNDPVGLINSLAKASQTQDIAPFVQMAGFDPAKLNRLSKVVRSYKAEDLNRGVIENALGAADVELGLARGVLAKRVDEIAAMRTIGNRKKAAEGLAELSKDAARAKVERADLARMLAEAEANPLLNVFKGGISLSEAASGTGGTTISKLLMGMAPDKAHAFMAALRAKNPEAAGMVSRKILADEMADIYTTSTQSRNRSTEVNIDELYRFFNPSSPKEIERYNVIKRIAGDAFTAKTASFVNALEKTLPKLREARTSGVYGEGALPLAAGAVGTAGVLPNVSGLGAASLTRRFGRVVGDPIRFHLLTYMATDPAFLAHTSKFNSFAEAIASMPMQMAYKYTANRLLMNDMAAADADNKKAGR